MSHPVVILDAAHGWRELDRLPPEETLADAKAAARSFGYDVIDSGPGGDCETTSDWRSGETVHLIMVKQRMVR